MRFIFSLIFLFILNSSIKCQNIDSLENVIKNSPQDSLKAALYINQIITPLKNNGEYEMAEKYCLKAIDKFNHIPHLKLNIGIVYVQVLIAAEKLNEASDLITKLMIKAIETKNIRAQAGCLKEKAFLQLYSGNYETAAELYYEALNKWKETNDLIKIAIGYGDLAVINYYLGHFKEASEYWQKSVDIYTVKNDIPKLAGDLGNLGLVQIELGDLFKAEQNLKKSLQLCIEINSYNSIANAYNNLSKLESHKNNLPLSIEYNKKSIEFFQKTGDIEHLINSYSNSAELYRRLKNHSEALNNINKAFELESQRNNKTNLNTLLYNRAAIYADIKKHKEAYEDILQHIQIKDSLVNSENQLAVSELEKKYELSEKENENKLLSERIKVKDVESDRQKLAISLIGIVLLFVAGAAFILIRQNREKNRINTQLAEKNNIIESQHKDIKDSIQYAKRIQDAILPPLSHIQNFLKDSFIYYKPKDIVAGDFYWMEHKDHLVFIAAADCTGHGVPGAMVSVVCSNALNRAVLEFNLTDPGKILDKTRDLVLETFAKSDADVKDGMDISLCVINNDSKTVSWAGANNPLWFTNDKNMIEITADKQPIGKSDHPKPFTTHSVPVKSGDSIFLFTDGYADQFGGPKGKKFKYKQFQELLLAKNNEKPEVQMQAIHDTFMQWKGPQEQIDDVCVIGFRI
ncbi:MAG: tetratricopeptide repeat protein [Bacteroidia bacterium]|nr:tetratricopeptide repeat protein [Bacteroidia bacterium]